MSRLEKTNWQGHEGWQWDDGPIFVGKNGRKHAVEYGKAIQWIDEWEKVAKLCQEQAQAELRLAQLKEMKSLRRM